MESILKIQGYHTCRVDGGYEYILENAPFISEPNNRQWLTQGYYFWTDSDYFAHKWGKESIKGDYVIVECAIELEAMFLLDLVGSVKHQQHFEKLLNLFIEKFNKTDAKDKPTVSEVIAFYRNQAKKNRQVFPYKAIKVQDTYQESKIMFVNNKFASLPLITRQQLCLFDCDCVKRKNIIHPVPFK